MQTINIADLEEPGVGPDLPGIPPPVPVEENTPTQLETFPTPSTPQDGPTTLGESPITNVKVSITHKMKYEIDTTGPYLQPIPLSMPGHHTIIVITTPENQPQGMR
jgi:hypothetical protein